MLQSPSTGTCPRGASCPVLANGSRGSRLEQSRSHRIAWLLEELNLSYDLKTFKRGSDMLAPAELKNIHPLGKSPVISIESPATSKPLVLAESGAIVEFLCDNFGGEKLIPNKYAPGKEGQIGGESESWLRYRFYMHYAEGSLMPVMFLTLLVHSTFRCISQSIGRAIIVTSSY